MAQRCLAVGLSGVRYLSSAFRQCQVVSTVSRCHVGPTARRLYAGPSAALAQTKPAASDVASGMAVDVPRAELPEEITDPSNLPMERDPSVSSYSTGSADILGGGPTVNSISAFSSAGFVVNDRRLKGL